MATAPSSNLLSALSQLQGSRPVAPAPRAAPNAAPSGAFAAELNVRVGEAGPARLAAAAPAAAQTPPAPTSPPPSRTRGLGQHVNILV